VLNRAQIWKMEKGKKRSWIPEVLIRNVEKRKRKKSWGKGGVLEKTLGNVRK